MRGHQQGIPRRRQSLPLPERRSQSRLAGVYPQPQTADLRRGSGCAHGQRLPACQPRLLPRPADEVGPEKSEFRRWNRQVGMARCAAPRSVERGINVAPRNDHDLELDCAPSEDGGEWLSCQLSAPRRLTMNMRLCGTDPFVVTVAFALLTAATSTAGAELPPLIPREVLFGNPERVSPQI